MSDKYLMVGVITKTKGFKGELVLTEVPKAIENVVANIEVKIGYSERFSKPYNLTQFKRFQKNANIKLKEITSDEAGHKMKELGLFVKTDNINRKVNTYIDHELSGCKVYNIEDGKLLGEICDVLELPANDVWIMRTETTEIPLPVIEDVIKSVDIDKKEIYIYLLDGLMELGK